MKLKPLEQKQFQKDNSTIEIQNFSSFYERENEFSIEKELYFY